MYPPNTTTYRNVRPKSGSSYWSLQKGRDSLSLSPDPVGSMMKLPKKLIKPKKKPLARSLLASLGYGCQLTFVAIVRLKGTCTSYRAGTTRPNSGSNGYGTTKVLAHLPVFDSWIWSIGACTIGSAGKGPAKLVPGRAGPCLLTALPHRVSIRYWLHGTSVLQVAIMLLNHVPFTISLSPMVHNNVDTLLMLSPSLAFDQGLLAPATFSLLLFSSIFLSSRENIYVTGLERRCSHILHGCTGGKKTTCCGTEFNTSSIDLPDTPPPPSVIHQAQFRSQKQRPQIPSPPRH